MGRTPTFLFLLITAKLCNSLICDEVSGAQDPLLGELLRSENERPGVCDQNVISSGFHSETPRGELRTVLVPYFHIDPCMAPGFPCTCLYVTLFQKMSCCLHNQPLAF